MSAITVIAVFFLIFVGGVVRASGSGMGCPDWPKCFGRWIPPTDVSQLPDNYQEIYAHRGYADTEFNALKTWIEYINRLIGASIGLMIFATLILSLSYWRIDKQIVAASFGAFVMVGFNGWLGSVVVKTNLVPVIITLHMIAALINVGLLIYAVARSHRGDPGYGVITKTPAIPLLLALLLVLSLIQLILGTQVREQVDEIALEMGQANRAQWSSQFGAGFLAHRSLSILVLAANVALAYIIMRKTPGPGLLRSSGNGLLGLIVAEIIVGALLYYQGMPAYLQPLHLVIAALIFGVQFHIAIAYRLAHNANGVAESNAA